MAAGSVTLWRDGAAHYFSTHRFTSLCDKQPQTQQSNTTHVYYLTDSGAQKSELDVARFSAEGLAKLKVRYLVEWQFSPRVSSLF